MNSHPRFLIVGGGKMGEAILSGWLNSDASCVADVSIEDIVVVNPSESRQQFLTQTYGVSCVSDVSEAPSADIVVLAVKPQIMPSVLENISKLDIFAGGATGPLFISIAAGLTTDCISAALPPDAPVVRVMPNMPLQVGAGASGVCGSKTSTVEQVALVTSLFEALGSAVVVDEGQMDAVCAISGSGPAYVAAMVEALTAAGVDEGLDAMLAEKLALQTVLGTAQLIDQTHADVAQTRLSICSPGGTTLAALEAMNKAGFDDVFKAGVHAAVVRSKELAACI